MPAVEHNGGRIAVFMFLATIVITFVTCWVYMGGYLADFVIWVISKLTRGTTDEKTVSCAVGGLSVVLGTVFGIASNDFGLIAGFTMGVGLYIAVRVPKRIQANRIKKELKAHEQKLGVSGECSDGMGTNPPASSVSRQIDDVD